MKSETASVRFDLCNALCSLLCAKPCADENAARNDFYNILLENVATVRFFEGNETTTNKVVVVYPKRKRNL